jgi:hypothetical protein
VGYSRISPKKNRAASLFFTSKRGTPPKAGKQQPPKEPSRNLEIHQFTKKYTGYASVKYRQGNLDVVIYWQLSIAYFLKSYFGKVKLLLVFPVGDELT